jgi:hypothetical protein
METVAEVLASVTVTVAVQESEFPFPSLTVRVTVFAPISSQSKVLISKLKFVVPQLSLEPLLIWEGVIVACPVLGFKATVIF